MIEIQLNKRDFEYDIYSLVKSFYPGRDAAVSYLDDMDEENSDRKSSNQKNANQKNADQKNADQKSAKAEDNADVELKISCFYEENQITIRFTGADDTLLLEDAVQICYEEDRKKTKNALKRLLYTMLKDLTGEELPWGNLTGIRPTKILWLCWSRDGKIPTSQSICGRPILPAKRRPLWR